MTILQKADGRGGVSYSLAASLVVVDWARGLAAQENDSVWFTFRLPRSVGAFVSPAIVQSCPVPVIGLPSGAARAGRPLAAGVCTRRQGLAAPVPAPLCIKRRASSAFRGALMMNRAMARPRPPPRALHSRQLRRDRTGVCGRSSSAVPVVRRYVVSYSIIRAAAPRATGPTTTLIFIPFVIGA